jgi:hypothetical protein
MRTPVGSATADRATVQQALQSRAWSMRDYALPLAASVALAVGITAGVFLGRQSGQPVGELALGVVPGESALHRLLERQPSGGTLEIGGAKGTARRLSVVATFRDRHARACREVEVLLPGADQPAIAAAVACRDAMGRWVVEGATRLASAPHTTHGGFEPSGVSEKDALEGLLTMLGAQRVLGPAEEKALIAHGWKN